MKKTIVLGLGVLLLWGCNNPEKETASSESKESQTEVQADHHHHESSEAIELNNGEKWIVNEEMKPYVTNGSELVANYIQENQNDHKALAEKLKDQNNKLIKSCTMKGKSHDELHKWLHPHLELVENLAHTEEAEEATNIVNQLQKSYQEYHEYFQ